MIAKTKLPDALRLSGLHTSCNMLNLQNLVGRIRRSELNPKTWTVSVNRLFDTQSGILPG
ncbi:hypothetical protein E4499_10140 [Escherichia coli]|nr:hypothetical protein [Escherichia coli]